MDGEKRGRRATIVDVAQRAGVSVSSASKVLRKQSYGVSDNTRSVVDAAIRELGYRPLASARAMRGKTFTIGVLAPDISNPFLPMLMTGVIDGLNSTDYELMIGPAAYAGDLHERAVDAMLDHQMDGLILIAPKLSHERLSQVAQAVPTVVIGRHGPADNFDTVASDDMVGAQQVVDHLVGLGHRRIAFIALDESDPDPRQPHVLRAQGYVQAMRDHGLDEYIDMIPAEWSGQNGAAIWQQLTRRAELPTAVFSGADVVAYSLLHEIWESGREVPGDISVVGYDDTPMAAMAPISLTSVSQQGVRMGKDAAKLLIERFDGRKAPVHLVLDPELMPRRSCSMVRGRFRGPRHHPTIG